MEFNEAGEFPSAGKPGSQESENEIWPEYEDGYTHIRLTEDLIDCHSGSYVIPDNAEIWFPLGDIYHSAPRWSKYEYNKGNLISGTEVNWDNFRMWDDCLIRYPEDNY